MATPNTNSPDTLLPKPPAKVLSATAFSYAGKVVTAVFLAVLLITTILAGWVSLAEGTTRFLQPFRMDNVEAYATQQVEALRANPTEENIRAVSIELWGLSKLVSVQHFVDSKLPEHGQYYASMPTTNQVLLLTHVLSAVFCMLFGGLQFWPQFRKRFMRAHRVIGKIYLVTVPVTVVLSLLYLALTPPHYIYDHLVAWIALWVFGGLALLSVTMAILALKARRVYEHQAWMALSFGSLLVAPMLRWDWVLLGRLFPAIDQQTLNLVTMGLMLPQCLLITYGLILINRQYQRPMSKRVIQPVAQKSTQLFIRVLPALYAAAVAVLAFNVWFFLPGQGLGSVAFAQTRLPAALIQQHQLALSQYPLITGLYVFSINLALPLGLYTFKRLLTTSKDASGFVRVKRDASLTGLLLAIAGLGSMLIGHAFGLAAHNLWFSGGTMYVVNGLVLAAFGLYLLGSSRAGQLALMKESLLFGLCLAPFAALFFATLWVLSLLPMPLDYIHDGQGYVIPVGFAGSLLFIAGFYVIYGQATREHN